MRKCDDMDGGMIIEITDTSVIRRIENLPLLAVGGKNPAIDNFCMEVAVSETIAEEAIDEMEEAYDSENLCEELMIARQEHKRKISYYVGTVRANFLDEDTDELPDVLLRSKCRFDNLSVAGMLETVLKDDEIEAYLQTGENNPKDALYAIDVDDEHRIAIDSYKTCMNMTHTTEVFRPVTSSVIEEIKKEYQLICYYESMRTGSDFDKETFLGTQYMIRPYAINLAVLFELYARACVKSGELCKEYEMLPYVPNKMKIAAGSGARTICRNADMNRIYMDGVVVPDIVLKKQDDGTERYVILDVKYKEPQGRKDRSDRLQLLAYAYLYDAKEIGHIFPGDANEESRFWVNSANGNIRYTMYYQK